MSIELLLKTIIVARGDKKLEFIHDLRKLAAEAGVVYAPQQLDLLDILSQAII